jgi:hypothetical protein
VAKLVVLLRVTLRVPELQEELTVLVKVEHAPAFEGVMGPYAIPVDTEEESIPALADQLLVPIDCGDAFELLVVKRANATETGMTLSRSTPASVIPSFRCDMGS